MGVKTFLITYNEALAVWQREDDPLQTWPALSDVPVGALWDMDWWHGEARACGPDGKALCVKCPDGKDWHIDGISDNCPDRDGAIAGRHKCWTRTGTPPNITVGKEYGPTCTAGAGSIDTGTYHGFLRNGEFT